MNTVSGQPVPVKQLIDAHTMLPVALIVNQSCLDWALVFTAPAVVQVVVIIRNGHKNHENVDEALALKPESPWHTPTILSAESCYANPSVGKRHDTPMRAQE